MGHKNRKIILSNSQINKEIFQILSNLIINNKAPLLLNDILIHLNFNTRYIHFNKYKNATQYIQKEYIHFLNFLKLNKLFNIIQKKENIYIDYSNDWIELHNPIDDIINF